MYTRVCTLCVNRFKKSTVQSHQEVYNANHTIRNIWRKIQENKNGNNSLLLSKHLEGICKHKTDKTGYH